MLGIWSIVPKVNALLLDFFLPDPSYTWADGVDGKDIEVEKGIVDEAEDFDLNYLAIVPFDPPTHYLDDAGDRAQSVDDDPVQVDLPQWDCFTLR